MGKLALLIGVNNYGRGLAPLKSPSKDVNALAEVLKQPEIGAFDRVQTLLDPNPQEMEGGIRDFFQSSRKEDLVLLYFSGHGIVDRSGSQFFLGTRSTCFSSTDDLYQTTVVNTQLIYELIDFCPCKQQVIILDCCHSGAFADNLTSPNNHNSNIKQTLERGSKRGRVILASCMPSELSYEQSHRELSLYTHHLVTGLKTSNADIDLDGRITVEDLHYYIQKQLQAESKMQPEMLSLQLEAGKLVLVQTTSTNKFTSEELAKQQKLAAYLRDIDDINIAHQIQLELRIEDRIAANIYARIGKEKQQQSQLNRAISLYQKALQLNSNDIATRQSLGDVLCWQNKWAAAKIHYQNIIDRHPHDSALALAYHGLGNTESNQNNPELAFSAYSQAKHLDSRLANLYIDWGITLYHQGKFEIAIDKIETSINIDENNPRSHHFLGIILTAIGQITAANLALERAIELWQNTIAANPYNSAAYGLLANALNKPSKLKEAEKAARKAIELNPYNAEAHNALGNVLIAQQKIEAAITAYTEAINCHPYLVVIHTNLGIALFSKGDLDGALAKYEYALTLNPHLFLTHRLIGDVFFNQGKFQEAIQPYKKAIEINRYDFIALYQLASVFRLSGRHAEANTESQIAITTCEQLLADNPKDIAANFGLAQALQFQGRLIESINIYLRILEIDDRTPFIHGSLGFALLQNKDWDRAKREFEIAISENSVDAMIFYGLGEVLSAQNRYELAIVQYQQSIRLNPRLPQVYVALGHISFQQNELSKASEYYQQAIALNPHDAWNYYHLGRVLDKQKSLDLAIEKIHHAISLNQYEGTFFNEIANMYMQKREIFIAIQYYQSGIFVQPTNPMLYYNLGLAIEQSGDLVAAVPECRMAVRLNRSEKLFVNSFVRILYRLVDLYSDSIQKINIYQEISIYDLNNPTAYNLMGNSWMEQNNWEAAVNSYQQAIVISDRDPVIYNNLASAFRYQRNFDKAKQAALKAVELNYYFADSHQLLGLIAIDSGDLSTAINSLNIAKSLFEQQGLMDRASILDHLLKEISNQQSSSAIINNVKNIFTNFWK
jgi:tetratricopeptide (TPR) repeat protein